MSSEEMRGASRQDRSDVVPRFLRDFSREHSADTREVLAHAIRSDRTERARERAEQNEFEKEIALLEQRLSAYNSVSFLSRVMDYLKIREIKTSLGIARDRRVAAASQAELRAPAHSGPEAIEALYESERGRWANAEYTKEDVERLFTEDHLASLSLDDYALLLKRFPSEMVTHVTRQGIRDHTGMAEHTAGEGAFQNGFEKMLRDGSLKSPLAIKLAEHGKDDAILDLLRSPRWTGELPSTKAEAIKRLEDFMTNGGQAGFADSASVHFAAEEVADYFYGSERGNEIFVAYPSALIGSQHYFSHGDVAPERTAGRHNDVWVLTQEERGLKLDAGLVFIPKDAQVDPKNGSRYEIGADDKPAMNEQVYRDLGRVIDLPDRAEVLKKIKQVLENFPARHQFPPPSTWEREIQNQDNSFRQTEALTQLLPIRDLLKQHTGISDDRVLVRMFDYNNARDLGLALDQGDARGNGIGRVLDNIVDQAGVRYEEAHNTVSSQEYWDAYFAAHPNEKPRHVVYYEGGSPSEALYRWRDLNGLTKRSDDANMGFAEHKLMKPDQQGDSIRERSSRFEQIALTIIEKRFSHEPT